MEISVAAIVPTLNAEYQIGPLLAMLLAQSRKPDEILVVDSSSEDRTVEIAKSFEGVAVLEVKRAEFNHGLTRDLALRNTSSEIVCFFTQDALPAHREVLTELTRPLIENRDIAIATGRQVAKPDARRFEQLVREYNYPAKSEIRSKADIPRLGIKAFFSSDVCAAYRRSTYLELGGFGRTHMSEDMLMAARAIHAGYKVAYCGNAEVIHSHDLTFRQQFGRNAAIGSFLVQRSDELRLADELGTGVSLAKSVLGGLARERRFRESLAFVSDCTARLLGNRYGRGQAQAYRG